MNQSAFLLLISSWKEKFIAAGHKRVDRFNIFDWFIEGKDETCILTNLIIGFAWTASSFTFISIAVVLLPHALPEAGLL